MSQFHMELKVRFPVDAETVGTAKMEASRIIEECLKKLKSYDYTVISAKQFFDGSDE